MNSIASQRIVHVWQAELSDTFLEREYDNASQTQSTGDTTASESPVRNAAHSIRVEASELVSVELGRV